MTITEFVQAAGQRLPVLNFRTPDWAIYLRSAGMIVTDADALKQNIEVIASTVLGSDPLRPEFGTSAAEAVDMPLTVVSPGLIAEISRAIDTYEKRVKVLSIKPVLLNSRVTLTVEFTIVNQPGAQAQTVTFGIQ